MEETIKTFETLNDTTVKENGTYYLPPYIFWYVSLANAVIFILGVTGNIFVLTVVITNKAMKTHMNILLCSLSVADLLVLLICQPAGMIEFYGKDRWFLGQTLCKLIPFLENASLNSSVITMWVISCERFQAICRAMQNSSCVGTVTAGKSIMCIWIAASAISVPFLFLTHQEPAKFFDGSDVMVCRTKIETSLHQFYIVLLFLTCFVLPLIVLTVIYCFILRTIYLTQRLDENRPSRHRKQIVAMIIAIIALFYISLFPIRIIALWSVFGSTESKESLGLVNYTNIISIARILMNLNSAGNPVIYGLISSKFRKAFKTTLRKCFCMAEKSSPDIGNTRRYSDYSENFQVCPFIYTGYCCHNYGTEDTDLQEVNN
ncbi:QRFP-like peptide receptor [Mytilus trossulus]|uniref:QRFP-like peptide receptor n=1 Tax=Mytilus trossulus TaxID=6551 RepID=UPI003006F25E